MSKPDISHLRSLLAEAHTTSDWKDAAEVMIERHMAAAEIVKLMPDLLDELQTLREFVDEMREYEFSEHADNVVVDFALKRLESRL